MVGREVNNFSLKDQFGNEFDLYKNLNKNILLIFYPKDNSRVCTRQLHNYQVNEELFRNRNIKLVGINTESSDSHKKFCEEVGIKFPLLFDSDKKISKYFKALNILGINKRKLVLIGVNKKILFEDDVPYTNYPDSVELVNNFDSLKNSP